MGHPVPDAAERPAHLDLNPGIELPEGPDVGEQIERARFVRPDDQLAGQLVAQLGERVHHLATEIFKLGGVFVNNFPGVGEGAVLEGPVEELLANFLLQALDGQTYGWLRPGQFLGGA